MVDDTDLNIQTFKQNNKIGIMGGTFDPIHFGHLFIAQTALDKLKLNKIIFIPTGKPPHKDERLITDSHKRVDMLNLAVKNNSKFETSLIEVTRKKTTYTIDTINELKQYYKEETDFYFITGTDAFIGLETWKKYTQLLDTVKFIVMTREVANSELLDEKIELFTKEYRANITKIEIPTLDISSTDIRRRVKEGSSIKYLLPENVEEYILKNRIYID